MHEAAWDLKTRMKNVTLIDRSDTLLSRQLDETGSKALNKAAEDLGIVVKPNATITKSIVVSSKIETGVPNVYAYEITLNLGS